MTESIPRKHHYIPESYMAPWAGPDRKVTSFWKVETGKVIRRRDHPGAIMYQTDLYSDRTHAPTEAEAQRLESRYLQQLDDQGVRLQKQMLAGQRPRTIVARRDWSRFVMSLMSRHPDSVGKLERLHSAMWQESLSKALPEIRAAVPDMDPVLAGALYAESWGKRQERERVEGLRRMMDYGYAGRVLNRSSWDVLDLSKSPVDLVLSDKPVYRTKTFREKGDFIAVPLGPRHLFKATIGRARQGPLDAALSSKIVTRINTALIRGAGMFVISVDAVYEEQVRAQMGSEPIPSIADIMAEPYAL
jgi:hypothetical protein